MTLDHSAETTTTPTSSSAVSVRDQGNGLFFIEVVERQSDNVLSGELARQLVEAIDAVQRSATVKALILTGTASAFLRGGRAHYNEAVERGLYRSIVSFPYPVIAAMAGDAIGAGFLAAALCDFMVCSQDAKYGYTQAKEGLIPTTEEARLFSTRFGPARARDLLYQWNSTTGRQLREKGWSCPVVPADQVESYANTLASNLAKKSRDSLRSLKQHLACRILELTQALGPAQPGKIRERRAAARVEIAAPGRHIQLEGAADDVLVLRICKTDKEVDAKGVVTDLSRLFDQLTDSAVNDGASYRAIVLMSEHADFLPRRGDELPLDAVVDLQSALLRSSLPVVAVLNSDPAGAAWLIGQLCDATVYVREGSYCAGPLSRMPGWANVAVRIFSHRLGESAARDIVLGGAVFSGAELQQRVGPALVAPQGDTLAAAVKLAEYWATWPLTAMIPTRHRPITIDEIDVDSPLTLETEPRHDDVPAPIALDSKVITATAHPRGIVVVNMEDREAKNLFSAEYVHGMNEVFQHIEETPDYKVVVLTGYDKYFASGGTKDALIAIQEGRAKFTDQKTYLLPFTCKLPVIAAMQGHAIGGGLSLGLFADFSLLSEESKYVSPYMNYGFTPGAGATLIVPYKLGHDLGRETLFTAHEYSGSELKDRGQQLAVYPRSQVHEAAMLLAERIALHSRRALVSLKERLNHSIHERLERNTQQEIAMHELTLVGHADTLKQIQTTFNPLDQTVQREPNPTAQDTIAASSVVVEDGMAAANLSPGAASLTDVTATIKRFLAHELHMKVDDIDEDTTFIDLGLDSITGVTWMRKINAHYRTSIQAIKVYSYPTLTKLSAYINAEVPKLEAPSSSHAAPSEAVASDIAPAVPQLSLTAPLERDARAPRTSRRKLVSWRQQGTSRIGSGAAAIPQSQPIAVIGMSGQFPKAKTLDQYWTNIAEGRNCISEIPQNRWDVDAYYQEGDAVAGKTNSKWIGCLDEYDLFDPSFFDISPKEALSMDPQQRLFLQTCWHAIEHAGYNPRSLSGSKCGVFVGCGPGDYHLLSRDLQISALGFTGGDTSILAARVSYFLDLRGPCLSIETACSSSLVALATACDNLISGSCDVALAGGVCVMTGPEVYIKMAQTGMLSRDGRCFTFDQRANGFVPGEGVGAVLLKRLSDAQRDGDIILGVIEGWGVNQDGKTNGITAPNPDSQTRLQQQVYDKYHVDPARIQLIETHGTGTKLGDPIEVDALKQSFKKYTEEKSYCALGSVKSNIGHCFTAAGIAGVIKVLLALQHKKLPPSINFSRLNEHISLDDSPFYVNDRLQEWGSNGGDVRRAAISGFGFGGTNAHMVIAEYSSPSKSKVPVSAVTESGRVIIPLSAKKPEQLQQRASDLLDFICEKDRRIDLMSMAYTLQVGREAMDERLGFLVRSVDELAGRLKSYIAEEGGEGIYRGCVRDSKEAMSLFRRDADLKDTIVEKFIGQRKLSKLLDLWVKDLEFDWNRLYGDSKPQRISLPTYPFAKERYWIETREIKQTGKAQGLCSALHPLLHRNTSSFSEHSYSSAFAGDEVFIDGARHDGVKTLTAVAYVEMARAAVAQATAQGREAVTVEMRDVLCGQPFAVGEGKEIVIALFTNSDETVDFEIYSRNEDEDVVHCQGRVAVDRQSAALKLDLAQLRERLGTGGANQHVVEVSLPNVAGNKASDLMLHPDVVDRVLRACAGSDADFGRFADGAYEISALRHLRVMSSCAAETAWVRHAAESGRESDRAILDIDLCDRQGNVCAQLRGLSLERFALGTAQQPAIALSTSRSQPRADQPRAVIAQAQLQQELKQSLADALFMKPSDISVNKPFIELGLDSIVGVEWINEVNKKYKLKITATKVYDYPNIADLASYLEKELEKVAPPAPEPKASAPIVKPSPLPLSAYPRLKRAARTRTTMQKGQAAASGKIAVVGMSGRYPQAGNLQRYWDNLAAGKNSIVEIPPSRWDVNQYYDPDPKKEGRIYCKWMGMLDDVECFDPLFFRISPAEAKNMDPQHRLFLEESYKAFENAGYSSKSLSNKKCGVYVGIIGTEYSTRVSNSLDITGNNPAIGAARVAYFLNLKGPAISIDTACSASLVAIHLACQGLLNHETDMALAGGVSVYLNPETYLGMCRAGMLSPDGQCKTFDDSANGFVPGEGAGVVVLKRLEDAERDNDFIHGVILGSGINQDGKTNGITAPSVNSQIELERELYSRYGIDPETIGYVETHGTGTKLGDPIELEALATVFKEKTSKRNYCGLGSVKSNIGHASGAAGVASVHKVLLCMNHRTLVPSLNVTKENSLFDFDNSPFYVSRETRAWDVAPGASRRAAVSSFGFSGTNAHLVIEEYRPAAPDNRSVSAAERGPGLMVVLSARTSEQLQQKAVDLLNHVRSGKESAATDLTSMAYTLLMGRDAMDERLGFLVSSADALVEKLDAYVRGDRNVEGVWRGKAERDGDGVPLLGQQEEAVDAFKRALKAKDFPRAMELWVRGLDLDWNAVYGDMKPQRIGLPAYPFARKRCWVDTTANDSPTQTRTVAKTLHPLLHRNISVLGQQTYSSTFSGEESFWLAHQVNGHGAQKVLPAVAYLEMARAAVENAVPLARESIGLELRNIAWGRPMPAGKDRQVNVALFGKGDDQVDFEIYSHGPESLAGEVVHCQGRAALGDEPLLARLDIGILEGRMSQGRMTPDSDGIAALYRGDREVLAQLHSPSAAELGPDGYVLHPALMNAAVHAAAALIDDSTGRPKHLSLPLTLDSIRIASTCTDEMFAWVRYSQSSRARDKFVKLDVDLCDRNGKVCIQVRGLAYEPLPVGDLKPVFDITTSSITVKQPPAMTLERRHISLVDPQPQRFARSTAQKPTEIVLQ